MASGGPVSTGVSKVLVVGNAFAGKTSLIGRYVKKTFSSEYNITIGVDFALKTVQTDDGSIISVQLWDIGGQERIAALSRIFYSHGVAAIVVFDILDERSLEWAVKWKEDIDAKVFLPSGDPIPVMLLANKCDLVSDGEGGRHPCISDDELAIFAKSYGFFTHFKVSAKTGENVKLACKTLCNQIAVNAKIEREKATQRAAETMQQFESQVAGSIRLSQSATRDELDGENRDSRTTGCCS